VALNFLLTLVLLIFIYTTYSVCVLSGLQDRGILRGFQGPEYDENVVIFSDKF
jgi:hypothetical protein